jgi:hypothetical protein
VKVTTAAELEQMTLSEREAHLRASIVRDLDLVPAEFLARVRSRLQNRLAVDDTAE